MYVIGWFWIIMNVITIVYYTVKIFESVTVRETVTNFMYVLMISSLLMYICQSLQYFK